MEEDGFERSPDPSARDAPLDSGSTLGAKPAADADGDPDEPLFEGGSPRWREAAVKRGSDTERRANDQPPATRDRQGAIERDG